MDFKEMNLCDIPAVSKMYVDAFNSEPWNDQWTINTASKRLYDMLNTEVSYGLLAYEDNILCGMVLGCKEQYYNGVMFNIKEFCVDNSFRGKGIGSNILLEFEKRLKLKGVSEIILFTSRNNLTEGFYNKMNYKSYNHLVLMGKEL